MWFFFFSCLFFLVCLFKIELFAYIIILDCIMFYSQDGPWGYISHGWGSVWWKGGHLVFGNHLHWIRYVAFTRITFFSVQMLHSINITLSLDWFLLQQNYFPSIAATDVTLFIHNFLKVSVHRHVLGLHSFYLVNHWF